jgi:hypothetical protein
MLIKNRKHNSDLSRSLFFLIIITIVGFIIRVNYLPDNIPLTLDAFRYFLLGMDISILGNLPIHYDKPNSGWPLFLSVIFQIFRFENYIDYMTLQKISSILFSVLTVIPVYFLAKRFFKQKLAMIGASFFIFSPYIVENSLLGVTDSLFIFLITIFLSLFFSDKKTNIICSFAILGISSLVRYESLLLIIPTTIVFLNKYKSDIDFRKLYFLGLFLFLITIIPMALWKIQMGAPDGLTGPLLDGAYVVINENSINSETIDRFDLVRGIINLPKYIGASLLPICFIFVPYSIISLLRKENENFRYLVLMGVFALIPALYAYSRGFEEIRYVFAVLPILIIASLFLIDKIILRFEKQNVIVGGLIALIIVSSIIYLDFRQPDYDYENEVVEVAKFVSGLPGHINDYGSESYYVEVMDLEDNKFPILSSEINFQSKVMRLQGETINEVIQDAKNKGLSYLAVTDDNQILSKIYHQEHNYPYLKKIFDSNEHHIKFKIKIFEINFNELDISR